MAKSQLLYEILWYVQNKKEFTAQELATHFNLSVRTIYRYLTDLADMGLYMEGRPGRYGGFSLLANQLLPPVLFVEDEIISLFFALQSLENYRDFPFKIDTISAKEKLLTVVPLKLQNRLRELAEVFQVQTTNQVVKTDFLTELLTATLSSLRIELIYASQRQVSTKKLEPIGVYGNNGFWYLFALDCQLAETRLYRIDRIQQLIVTTEVFTRKLTLADRQLPSMPAAPLALKVLLTVEGAKRCLESPILAKDVSLNSDGSGQIETQINPTDLSFTADFFLTLGKTVKVIEPEELITLLKTRAQEILTTYLDVKINNE